MTSEGYWVNRHFYGAWDGIFVHGKNELYKASQLSRVVRRAGSCLAKIEAH